MKNKCYVIEPTSVEQYFALNTLFQKLGWNVTKFKTDDWEDAEFSVQGGYNFVLFPHKKRTNGYSEKKSLYDNCDAVRICFQDVMEKGTAWLESLVEKQVTVKLNSEYTAIVGKNTIEVGCQKFPIDILDELCKARDEVSS